MPRGGEGGVPVSQAEVALHAACQLSELSRGFKSLCRADGIVGIAGMTYIQSKFYQAEQSAVIWREPVKWLKEMFLFFRVKNVSI